MSSSNPGATTIAGEFTFMVCPGFRMVYVWITVLGLLATHIGTPALAAVQPNSRDQSLPYLSRELAESAYPDTLAAMAPPLQRTDRLMVRWPGIIYANAVIVLMYHDVASFVAPALPSTIPARQFQEHLQYLHDAGYNIITHQQFAAFMLNGASVPYNAILITFDDGYRSFYTTAYPLLRKWGMPATNFLIIANTDHINTSYHRPSLQWSQIMDMERSGIIHVEPHTFMAHRYVRLIPTRKQQPWYIIRMFDPATGALETDRAYMARISTDMYRARTTIEQHLGGSRISLAYPYGARNAQTDAAAKLAGIHLLFTVRAGIVTRHSDPAMLPRINGGSPAVTAAVLDETIRKVVMGKRYTRFDLPSIRQLQRGARINRLETCCRLGPLPGE